MAETTDLAPIVDAVRQDAALFDMTERRGLIEVAGEDRVRWLDGMISGDVGQLEARGEGAGCYATLLTNRGAIIADLHVGLVGDTFLLESARSEISRILEALDRFIIADDVTLTDRSADFATIGLEGARAASRLAAQVGSAAGLPDEEQWARVVLGGDEVLVGAFGWSGETAYQLRVPVERAKALRERLAAADAETRPLPWGSEEVLEILRVEAGRPALANELDDVLPPEARLEHAIATDKGCYVGQEIVARLRARGQVNHLLVGFELKSEVLPAKGTPLQVADKATGELTSVVDSPSRGPIALGYVRREHSEPATVVTFEGGEARVVPLPIVALGGASSA